MGKPLELDRQQQPTAASQRLHAVAAPGGEQQQRQLQPDNSRLQADSASLRTAAAASGCINTADCTAPADRSRNSASCKQQQHNRLRASGNRLHAGAAKRPSGSRSNRLQQTGCMRQQASCRSNVSCKRQRQQRGADSSSRLLQQQQAAGRNSDRLQRQHAEAAQVASSSSNSNKQVDSHLDMREPAWTWENHQTG